jgi:uncharacterized protein YgiM (DUF1202 family)
MAPIFSALGLLIWPVSIVTAFAVFGISSESTLSLLHQHFSANIATASMKSGMTTPIIHMPETPKISAEAAQARVAALDLGRTVASTSSDADASTPSLDALRMKAATALTIRAKATKLSPPVGTLPKGAIVTVKSKQRGWLLVEFEQGRSGWVFSKYLLAVPF